MYKLFFDGGQKKDGITFGYVIKDENNIVLFSNGGIIKDSTLSSNVAEYVGLIMGVLACVKLNYQPVEIFGDSLLIINQVNGTFKIKNKRLRELYSYYKEVAQHCDIKSLTWIPRKLNEDADNQTRINS